MTNCFSGSVNMKAGKKILYATIGKFFIIKCWGYVKYYDIRIFFIGNGMRVINDQLPWAFRLITFPGSGSIRHGIRFNFY